MPVVGGTQLLLAEVLEVTTTLHACGGRHSMASGRGVGSNDHTTCLWWEALNGRKFWSALCLTSVIQTGGIFGSSL